MLFGYDYDVLAQLYLIMMVYRGASLVAYDYEVLLCVMLNCVDHSI
jgi:hypothetical protein